MFKRTCVKLRRGRLKPEHLMQKVVQLPRNSILSLIVHLTIPSQRVSSLYEGTISLRSKFHLFAVMTHTWHRAASSSVSISPDTFGSDTPCLVKMSLRCPLSYSCGSAWVGLLYPFPQQTTNHCHLLCCVLSDKVPNSLYWSLSGKLMLVSCQIWLLLWQEILWNAKDCLVTEEKEESGNAK